MKGLILCGGKGTRLRPYSYSRPKHLLPVANQPVIQYAIDNMRAAGIKEIGIVIPPYFKAQFEAVLGRGPKGTRIHYIKQQDAKGLADAVRVSREFIENDSFLLFLGDNFYSEELGGLLQQFNQQKPSGLLVVSKVQNPTQFGVVKFEGDRVVQVIEKPAIPPSPYAIVGVYVFTPEIFNAIEQIQPSARGEYEITDAIQQLINNGLSVLANRTDCWWKDTGQPTDLLACNRHALLDLRGENYAAGVNLDGSTIEGPVMIQEGAEIINSVIRGPATIGAATRIVGSYIGPFSSIGNNVHIESCEIENCIVLERTQIIKITKRIDESIIGGDVTLQGANHYPKSLRVNLGDHSKVYLPLED